MQLQGRKTTNKVNAHVRPSPRINSWTQWREQKNAPLLSFKHSLDCLRKRVSGEIVRPIKFISRILCCVASIDSSFYFFRTTVLRKLFDIRFSFKHCYFSRGCLLVKMASKWWQGLFSIDTRSSLACLKNVFFSLTETLWRALGKWFRRYDASP